MSFDYLMGYSMSISMCMQNFIIIFHSVQEIAPVSLFQNLELGKASTKEKCHFAISWARSCQYQCLRKSLSKYSTQFKRQGNFHFFRIWSSAKPRPMLNVISQSCGLDLVNINVYAKIYQNIPLSSRDRAIFTFSELEPRKYLGQSQMKFDNLLGYILSILLRMQNFIKIFQTV